MAIIGDGFQSYVQKQIGVRQKALGDFNNRKLNDLKALQTRTPWIRLVSSVDIDGGDGSMPGKSVRKTMADMGFNMDSLDGDQAAKKLVLFSGVSNNRGKRYSGLQSGGIFGGAHSFRAGTMERGHVPMPGITGASFSYKNDGALAQGEVNLKCFNRAQFQLLDVLYQRPGYTCLLEFGWSVYLGNDGKIKHRTDFATKPYTQMWSQADMFQLSEAITNEKKSWEGNYDGFFAKITKFNWKFNGDGSYDITVNLIGCGDVIQSFKTNLAPSKAMVEACNAGNWDDDDRTKANEEGMIIAADAITTVLNATLFDIFNRRYWASPNRNKEVSGTFPVILRDVPIPVRSNGKITSWKKKTITHSKGGFQIKGTETDQYKWYQPSTYITLNTLIALLAANCNMHNPKDDSPIISYDMDFENPSKDKNMMATFPGMYTGNPGAVLILYEPVSTSITTKVSMPNGVVNKFLKEKGIKFYANDDCTFGRLGNVYLDVNHIATILKENKDEDDNILLLDFLNAILSSINLKTGGINEFRVIHDVETNFIRIISEKPLNEKPSIKPCVINTYGVTKDNGSFVRQVDLSAELTDKFATMISIGAQANGNSAAGNATAFSIYNKGLKDRVTPEKAVLTTTSQSAEEETDPFKKIWTEEFTELFKECWGDPNISYSWGMPKGQGLDFTSETIGPLEAAVQEWAQLCTGALTQKKQYPAPFFLPFNLSLTMDGLGGMKIYNAFQIDDKILPATYDTEHIELIIKSLSHEISETDWTTKVETLSKPVFGKVQSPTKNKFGDWGISSKKRGGSSGVTVKGYDYPIFDKTLTNGYPIGEIYIKQETKKNFIFLHHTAGHTKGPKGTLNSWSKSAYAGEGRVSTHYVIGANGDAEQVFDDKYWAGHAGVKGGMYLNKQGLSIEIQAIGPLRKVGSNPDKFTSTYYDKDHYKKTGIKIYSKWPTKRYGGTWTQPVNNDLKVIRYKGYDWYQKYTNFSIEATRNVCLNWMSKHNIKFHYDYDCLFPNSTPKCFPDPGSSGNGIYTHNSVRTDKSDIFPQKEMVEMLKGIKTTGG